MSKLSLAAIKRRIRVGTVLALTKRGHLSMKVEVTAVDKNGFWIRELNVPPGTDPHYLFDLGYANGGWRPKKYFDAKVYWYLASGYELLSERHWRDINRRTPLDFEVIHDGPEQ